MCWLGFRVSGSLFFGNPRWHGATPGEVSGRVPEVAVGEKNQHTPQLILPFFPRTSFARGATRLACKGYMWTPEESRPQTLFALEGRGWSRATESPRSLPLQPCSTGRGASLVFQTLPIFRIGQRFRFVTFFLGLQRPGYQMSATSREVCPAPRQSPNKISCFYKISAHNAPLALLRCLASWQKQVWSSRQLDVFVPMLRLCQ